MIIIITSTLTVINIIYNIYNIYTIYIIYITYITYMIQPNHRSKQLTVQTDGKIISAFNFFLG